jgi:hypothetical protein
MAAGDCEGAEMGKWICDLFAGEVGRLWLGLLAVFALMVIVYLF